MVSTYPRVLSEADTVARAQAGMSLARYGDGEWKICLGANCVSQRFDPQLASELREILVKPPAGLLACIPNLHGPLPANKAKGWAPYKAAQYLGLLGKVAYGSSFISRPDSAPWIDTPEYWGRIEALWEGRDVILVTGHYNEIRPEQLKGARWIGEVAAARQHAYATINEIEHEIVDGARRLDDPLVVMCLGPTATVLAARLQRRNVQALDLGHLGMFMRHAGQYRVQLDELVSLGYQDELQAMHRRQKWGAAGHSHALTVRQLIADLQPKTILDYGCGAGTLREAMKDEFRILEYDPGIPDKAGLPKPVDLVVCTDVAEHIEPKKVGAVLAHIERIAEIAAYFVIALDSSRHILPGGRNAHLSIHSADWWIEKITAAGFKRVEVLKGGKGLRLLAKK